MSKTYYAVCNANGPISVRLDGETKEEAHAAFAALDTLVAIDRGRADAEDDLGIEDAEGMDDDAFGGALTARGAELVADLGDGWSLWRVARDNGVAEVQS